MHYKSSYKRVLPFCDKGGSILSLSNFLKNFKHSFQLAIEAISQFKFDLWHNISFQTDCDGRLGN